MLLRDQLNPDTRQVQALTRRREVRFASSGRILELGNGTAGLTAGGVGGGASGRTVGTPVGKRQFTPFRNRRNTSLADSSVPDGRRRDPTRSPERVSNGEIGRASCRERV